MKLSALFLFTALFFAGTDSDAHILRTKTILEKTAARHGGGIYEIRQETIFRNETESAVIMESWTVGSGDVMYLEARGAGHRYIFSYQNKRRSETGEAGNVITRPSSEDFLEPVFLMRSSAALGSLLTKFGLIPASAMEKDALVSSPKDIKHPSEPFIRLSRVAGTVAYAFGIPVSSDSPTALPGLWIEQDKFTVRKLRFPSTAEVNADDYQEHAKNLWFPRERTVSWNGKAVTIRTVQIYLQALPEIKKLSPGYLKTLRSEDTAAKHGTSTLAPLIKEFYSRFR